MMNAVTMSSLNLNLNLAPTISFSSSPRQLPLTLSSIPPTSSSNSCYYGAASTISSSTCNPHLLLNRPLRFKVNCSAPEPLKVMISGAPASGKGTQCQTITQKFGVIHISTGDLLRAEVAAGTEIGNKAKEYMNSGRLVPDEIVTVMVRERLSSEDAKKKGWLLDGYPRSLNQAQSLEQLGITPDVYIVLEVPDEILIDRCVGRRLDPVTGKIYHIRNFPPETEEIKARLVTRFDDTEEKVKSRLEIYKRNAEAVSTVYKNVMRKLLFPHLRISGAKSSPVSRAHDLSHVLSHVFQGSPISVHRAHDLSHVFIVNVTYIQIDGNLPKEDIFAEIMTLLSQVQDEKAKASNSGNKITKSTSFSLKPSHRDKWRGIPTMLNNIPHSREIREYFYNDVLQATQRAVSDGKTRLKVEINIPELNPEMDVYRIGTLLEMIRVIALSFANDGKRVKVCVQGSMGEGALAGIPLQLAGTRKILDIMDWGDYGAKGTFINTGSIGAKEVDEQDDMFILVAPQNAIGNCIIEDLKAMTDAAANRPVILINPKLKDLPSSSGIMQTMGRDKRLEYAASFDNCYFFRLLYYAGTQYPIMAALRMTYPFPYELYKRVDEVPRKEKYVILSTFEKKPDSDDINNAFLGKPKDEGKKLSGFWGFFRSLFD